jgi:hypothetical protein
MGARDDRAVSLRIGKTAQGVAHTGNGYKNHIFLFVFLYQVVTLQGYLVRRSNP